MKDKVLAHGTEPGFWIGRWKNVAIQCWGASVTVARINRCAECHHLVLREHPDRLVTFAIVFASASPRIGTAEQERIRSLAREQQGATLAAVQVIDGTGFWASTVRALLTGLNMLSTTKQRVFSNDLEAAEWLVKAGFVAGTSTELQEAVSEARRQYSLL